MSNRKPKMPLKNVSSCPDSLARWYCLNGATCFSVLVNEATLYNCWCQNGFHGARCDYKHTKSSSSSSSSSLSMASHDDNKSSVLSTRDVAQSAISQDLKETTGSQDHRDHLAALGLVVGATGIRSTASDQPNKQQQHQAQQTFSSNNPLKPKALPLIIYCLSFLLMIVLCILLIQKLFKKQQSPRPRVSTFAANTKQATESPGQQVGHGLCTREAAAGNIWEERIEFASESNDDFGRHASEVFARQAIPAAARGDSYFYSSNGIHLIQMTTSKPRARSPPLAAQNQNQQQQHKLADKYRLDQRQQAQMVQQQMFRPSIRSYSEPRPPFDQSEWLFQAASLTVRATGGDCVQAAAQV